MASVGNSGGAGLPSDTLLTDLHISYIQKLGQVGWLLFPCSCSELWVYDFTPSRHGYAIKHRVKTIWHITWRLTSASTLSTGASRRYVSLVDQTPSTKRRWFNLWWVVGITQQVIYVSLLWNSLFWIEDFSPLTDTLQWFRCIWCPPRSRCAPPFYPQRYPNPCDARCIGQNRCRSRRQMWAHLSITFFNLRNYDTTLQLFFPFKHHPASSQATSLVRSTRAFCTALLVLSLYLAN